MPDSVITQDKDGAEFEFESAAIARKARPDAKIVRFAATGEPYKADTKPAAAAPRDLGEAGGELAEHVDESSGSASARASAVAAAARSAAAEESGKLKAKA